MPTGANMGQRWSEAEDAALSLAWQIGEETSKIAHILKELLGTERSRSAIIGRAQRLGLPRHQLAVRPQVHPRAA